MILDFGKRVCRSFWRAEEKKRLTNLFGSDIIEEATERIGSRAAERNLKKTSEKGLTNEISCDII